MASIAIHTGILTSPKHVPLSDGALRLWLHGLCWSKEHLTDGFIPQDMVPSLHPKARRFVGELLTVRVPGKGALWDEAEGGYRIHDYADWQETSDAVQTRRRKWRAAKRGKPVDSTPDSDADSTVESYRESREGSGSGVGRGVGIGSADHPTRPFRASSVRLPRDAYLGLIEAWNVEARGVASWVEVDPLRLDPPAISRAERALQTLPDLDAWEARFARAARSSHLTGRNGKGFVADFWWLLERTAELDAGRFDDRGRSAADGESRRPELVDISARIAAEAEERRLAAEERAARQARKAGLA